MTQDEFNSFIEELKKMYRGFEEVLTRSPMALNGLSDMILKESIGDANMGLWDWFTSHPAGRQPSVSEIGETIRLVRLNREKRQHVVNDKKVHKNMTAPPLPWYAATEADKAWALFHIRWTGNALERMERRTSLRHVEKFPWAELVKAYAQFAGKWPEYSDDCDRAVQTIMAKHPEAFAIEGEESHEEVPF